MMDKWGNLSRIQIFVIADPVERIPVGLELSDLPIKRYDHIPSDIHTLTWGKPSIIITSQPAICRQLVVQNLQCLIFIALDTLTDKAIDEAFSAGASDYLSLPLRGHELRARTRTLFPLSENDARIMEAEARYTGMIENASDAILVLQNDRIIYANHAAHDLLDYTNHTLQNQLVWSHIHPDYLETLQSAFIHFSQDEVLTERYEIQIMNRQNLPVDIELSISKTEYAGIASIALFMRDIGERKLSEQIVREAQKLLQVRAESLITINEIADSLHQALDIKELAHITVDVCRRYLKAELSVFYLADYKKQVLNLIASNGTDDSSALLVKELAFDNSLTGRLIEEKRVIISGEIVQDPYLYEPTKEALIHAGMQCVICVPALHDGRVLAALNLIFSNPDVISDETFTTLQAIGQTLGLALSKAKTVDLLVEEISERQSVEDQLRLSQERLKSVITNVPVILFATDENGMLTLFEGRGLELIGFDRSNILGQSIYDVFPDSPEIHRAFEQPLTTDAGFTGLEINDMIFDVYYSPSDGGKGLSGVCIDVTERTHAARLQRCLFNISQASSETESFTTLWTIVQQELSNLIDTTNFYVAIHDPETNLYHFPFWQDVYETDENLWHTQELEKTLTDYVRRTGQPLIVDDTEHHRLHEKGLIRYEEIPPFIWLGVPLKTTRRIIGVMATQSYDSADIYTPRDLEIMQYIGENIARVIENKQSEDALRASEETAREFQEKLQVLHEISFELTEMDNLNDIYRRAVEAGHEKLGYDRVALFLVDIENNLIQGTFGTDEKGQIRDEHDAQHSLSGDPRILTIINEGWETRIFKDTALKNYWEVVGNGWNGVATLWNGSQVIGTITVDNLLNRRDPRPFEEDLLRMFGAVIGYIISGKEHNIARQQMVEQLQLLNAIDQAILVAASPLAIAQAVVHPLKELMGVDYTSIVKLNRDTYDVLAWTEKEVPPANRPLKDANDILTNESLHNGHMYTVHNLQEQTPLSLAEQRLINQGLSSYSILPLLADAELVGILTIGSATIGEVSSEKLNIAGGIATQLALAFRQALLLEQVQAYATDLEKLVEERTAQLTAKAQELEAFTSSVSHDLRAPLRAISGFAEVVIEDFEDQIDEDVTYYLERIRYNANRMGHLIDDLLRLSRIGQRELGKKSIQPENTIRAIIEELAGDDQIGNAIISINPLPECQADPILLKQLWVNLISNAIKYSRIREQARINIGIITQDNIPWYFIRDNGIGFDMTKADKLFGVFQRMDNASNYEGNGVGLATVARIVNLHQGRVRAESIPGGGATFYFTLSFE